MAGLEPALHLCRSGFAEQVPCLPPGRIYHAGGHRRQPAGGNENWHCWQRGAGKSTVTVLLARQLIERGYEVCVVDADSANLGLHRALGADRAPVPLIDFFGGMVFRGGAVTCPVDDPTRLPGARLSISSLPRNYRVQPEPNLTLLTAGKLGEWGAGAGCDGPLSKIVRDLDLTRDGGNPVSLVDFKAGFEDLARGVITGVDWVLVVVDPTQASIALAAHVRNLVADLHAGRLPATRHLESAELVQIANEVFRSSRLRGFSVLLNKISSEAMRQYVTTALAASGIQPIGAIPYDEQVSLAWLHGSPVASAKGDDVFQHTIRHLEQHAGSWAVRG